MKEKMLQIRNRKSYIRRKYTRRRVNELIEYSYNNSKGILAYLLDISEVGAKVRINHVLDVGDLLDIYILSGETVRYVITGEIVYRNGNIVGLRFNLNECNSLFLKDYLKEVGGTL